MSPILEIVLAMVLNDRRNLLLCIGTVVAAVAAVIPGTSCGRWSRPAQRSWINCSVRTVDKQIDKQSGRREKRQARICP